MSGKVERGGREGRAEEKVGNLGDGENVSSLYSHHC